MRTTFVAIAAILACGLAPAIASAETTFQPNAKITTTKKGAVYRLQVTVNVTCPPEGRTGASCNAQHAVERPLVFFNGFDSPLVDTGKEDGVTRRTLSDSADAGSFVLEFPSIPCEGDQTMDVAFELIVKRTYGADAPAPFRHPLPGAGCEVRPYRITAKQARSIVTREFKAYDRKGYQPRYACKAGQRSSTCARTDLYAGTRRTRFVCNIVTFAATYTIRFGQESDKYELRSRVSATRLVRKRSLCR